MSWEDERLYPVKYIVCVRDNETSLTAVRFAASKAAKAKKRGGAIDLLHVIPPANFLGLGSVAEKIKKESRQKAEKILNRLADECIKCSGITPSIMIKTGDIGEQILNTIKEDDSRSNILVLSASPESSGGGKLISWLAARTGDTLNIPLMIVPGNLTLEEIREIS